MNYKLNTNNNGTQMTQIIMMSFWFVILRPSADGRRISPSSYFGFYRENKTIKSYFLQTN